MTTEKAIKRGQLLINIPVLIIILGIPGLFLYLVSLGILESPTVLVGFLLGFLLAWLYWTFAITQWRIWALSKTEDPFELRLQAETVGLIWPEGSFFEKTEIRTARQNHLIQELEKRKRISAKRKIFKDDKSISKVTILKYSKINAAFNLLLPLFMTYVGLFLIYDSSKTLAYIILSLSAYSFFKSFTKFIINFPSDIKLDEGGITYRGRNYRWNDLSEVKAFSMGYGKNQSYYLRIKSPYKTLNIDITEYSTSVAQLRHIIKIYKGRNNSSNSAS